MSQQDHAVDGILDDYRAVRGEDADETWAGAVLMTLVLRDVPDEVAGRILREALPLVAETGEGPEELYGEPRAWALERLAEETDEGRAPATETGTTWREMPVLGLLMAAMFTVLFLVVMLVDGLRTDYTPGVLLFPLLAGLFGAAMVTAYERTLARRSRPVAVGAGAAVAALGVGVTTAVLMTTHGQVLATASVFWMLALALGYAALAVLVERLLPEKPSAAADPGAVLNPGRQDEVWRRDVAGALRLRAGMDERRVREILREADEHAARSGRSLTQEFGPAGTYAARFSRDDTAQARRRAWLWTVLIPVAALIAFGSVLDTGDRADISWWGVLMLVASVLSAVQAWSRARSGDRRD